MKTLMIIIFFTSISFFKGQIGNERDWKIVAIIVSTRIEATCIDKKVFFSFGPKIPVNENNFVSLRGHFNWWDLPDRKLIVIPELDYLHKVASFEKDRAVITNLYLGAGITPNAVSPKFGINLYYLFTIELGYNYEFDTYKHFSTQGFRFSSGINIIF